jgi:hypothetical protein
MATTAGGGTSVGRVGATSCRRGAGEAGRGRTGAQPCWPPEGVEWPEMGPWRRGRAVGRGRRGGARCRARTGAVLGCSARTGAMPCSARTGAEPARRRRSRSSAVLGADGRGLCSTRRRSWQRPRRSGGKQGRAARRGGRLAAGGGRERSRRPREQEGEEPAAGAGGCRGEEAPGGCSCCWTGNLNLG